jgi:hypothetical protein
VQGSGTFVARSKYESTLVAIRNISDEVVARDHRHHTTMMHIGASIADAAATPGADARAARDGRDGRERALYRAPSAYVVQRPSRVYLNPVASRLPFPIFREFLSEALCAIASARRVSVTDLHSLSIDSIRSSRLRGQPLIDLA